jgi:hypothetical protein
MSLTLGPTTLLGSSTRLGIGGGPSAIDTVTVADTAIILVTTRKMVASDTVTTTDTPAILVTTRIVAAAETVAATDTPLVGSYSFRPAAGAETITTTDTGTVGGIIPVSVSLTEPYLLAGVAQPITAQETITTTAEFTAIARGEPPRSAVVAPDPVRITDAVQAGVNPYLIPVAETVTVTDTGTADVGSHGNITRTETIKVRDTARVLAPVHETYTPLGGIINDTISGGDVANQARGGVIMVGDRGGLVNDEPTGGEVQLDVLAGVY